MQKITWNIIWIAIGYIYIANNISTNHVSLVVNTSRSFPHSWLITGFVTTITRHVPLVELELLTPREHLSSPPVFSGVRVTWSFALCVCFVYRCLSIYLFLWPLCCLFFFDLRIRITSLVSSNSSYGCISSVVSRVSIVIVLGKQVDRDNHWHWQTLSPTCSQVLL